MNFQEWYKFGTPEEQNCFMGDAEMGWDACKQEVLEIIKKSKYINTGNKMIAKYGLTEYDFQIMIEKIEKL